VLQETMLAAARKKLGFNACQSGLSGLRWIRFMDSGIHFDEPVGKIVGRRIESK
jgi:hypothetical protein